MHPRRPPVPGAGLRGPRRGRAGGRALARAADAAGDETVPGGPEGPQAPHSPARADRGGEGPARRARQRLRGPAARAVHAAGRRGGRPGVLPRARPRHVARIRLQDAAVPDRPLPIKSFLTPTPAEYRSKVSQVAPLLDGGTGDSPSRLAVCRRPALESRAEVEKALEACRKRPPRLPLVEEARARALLPRDW